MIVALVLVPCNQVEDIANKQHLTWTTKVLLEGSKFQMRPLFTSATHFECPQHHELLAAALLNPGLTQHWLSHLIALDT